MAEISELGRTLQTRDQCEHANVRLEMGLVKVAAKLDMTEDRVENQVRKS